MQRPLHADMKAQSARMSPQRLAAVAGVGLLHVVFIWALITGMAQKIVKALPQDLQVNLVTAPPQPATPPSPPKLVKLPTETPTVPPPVITIAQQPTAAPITATVNSASSAPPANNTVSGLLNTHTTPPYPDVARRLGEQGSVLLHLSISPAGDVTGATVSQSSGFADLDQAAVNWVVAHWKYKPAILNGTPVASYADALVKFDLKNAN